MGLAALQGREQEFIASEDQALAYADALGHCAVHVMGGLAEGVARAQVWDTYARNLEEAVEAGRGRLPVRWWGARCSRG